MSRYSYLSDQRVEELIKEKKKHINNPASVNCKGTNEQDLAELLRERSRRR